MPSKQGLDLSEFPPGTVQRHEIRLCLKCVFDIFTRQLGLKARAATTQVRDYTPAVEELTTQQPARPYFRDGDQCPHCDSAARWHVHIVTIQIEGGKATDGPRRKLVKALPGGAGGFAVLESKTTRASALAAWLDRQRTLLDFERPGWLRFATRAYLERKEPKTDWREVMAPVRTIRRSSRLDQGWEVDAGRLFLSPPLYAEVLVVQYLLSRTHLHGAETSEGRLTLAELVNRLRHTGYLHAHGIHAHNPADVLEETLALMSGGGEEAVKYHYIVDRRDLLDKAREIGGRAAEKEKTRAAPRKAARKQARPGRAKSAKKK